MSESPDEPKHPGFEFPDDFAQCIAQITAAWSALEYNVDMSIWHLAGVYPAIGACITGQIYTLQGRISALVALMNLRKAPTNLISRVNKFSESVRKPLEIRNRLVHDQWFRTKETGQMKQLEIGAKGTLTYGFKRIDIEPLTADMEVVRTAMREAGSIRDAIETALPTLPEIPLEALHPTVLHGRGHEQTRSNDDSFLLFPPKPLDPLQEARRRALELAQRHPPPDSPQGD